MAVHFNRDNIDLNDLMGRPDDDQIDDNPLLSIDCKYCEVDHISQFLQ